jgi:hypothetical protein
MSIEVPQRSILRIITSTGKSIFCEGVGLDHNFIRRYNRRRGEDFPSLQLADISYDEFGRALPDGDGTGVLFINEYYRARLGRLQVRRIHDLTVRQENSWMARTRACLQHPQVGIRISTLLGLLSLGLGLLALLLGVISVYLGLLALHSSPH